MNKLKKYSFICCFFVFGSFFGFSQEIENNLESFRTQRLQLAENNESYMELEKTFAGLGQFPPALVTKMDVGGKTKFNFSFYRTVRPGREEAIAQRIKSSISGIESIVISNQQVVVVFEANAPETSVNDFFKMMGYTSYELKH